MTQKQYFICLANSWKYTGRCIAGIRLVESTSPGRRYDIVKDGDRPVWVRPVSDHERGEVDEDLVKEINLLDIVHVELRENVRLIHQSENWNFNRNSFRVVETVSSEIGLLDKLVSPEKGMLFGSSSDRIMAASIGQVDHSLLLIKPDNTRFHYQQRDESKPQLRVKFGFHGHQYDLAITDPGFVRQCEFTPDEFKVPFPDVYLTISLGTLYMGAYYKLVAGVIQARSDEVSLHA